MVVGSWVVVGLYMVRWWWDGGIADGAWVGKAWVRYVLHDPDHNVARKRDADQVVQLHSEPLATKAHMGTHL